MRVRSCGMSGSETGALVSVGCVVICAQASGRRTSMCAVAIYQEAGLLVAMRRIDHVRVAVEYVCSCARGVIIECARGVTVVPTCARV